MPITINIYWVQMTQTINGMIGTEANDKMFGCPA